MIFFFQEGELSQDLYTFHEAVSALQMLEEEVLDTHKLVMDNTTKFLNDAHGLFSATHEVDYDQEGKTNSFAHLCFFYWLPVCYCFNFSYTALC